jgi:hypothetical protein
LDFNLKNFSIAPQPIVNTNVVTKEYLDQKTIEDVGIINYPEVKKIIEQFYEGKNYLYSRIWLLIVLHKWFKDNKIFLS